MDPAAEIALKAGTPILTFLLGRASPRIVAELKYRRTKRFWRPVARSEPTVVVGTHQLPHWEASSLMSTAEARAIDELRTHLRSLYLPDFTVSFGDELPRGRTLGGTLLCFGGPDTSVVAARAWRSACTSFVWGDPELHELSIRDEKSGGSFGPEGFGLGEVTRDYALVVKTPNPFAQPESGASALLFAGCLGYGTWAALRFAISDEFVTDSRIIGSDAMECLLAVDVVAGAPQRIELLEVRQLPAPRSAPDDAAQRR